jgi:methylglyoxal synthase
MQHRELEMKQRKCIALVAHDHKKQDLLELRIAVLWNIPIACNRASADFMISSALMAARYRRLLPECAARAAEVTALSASIAPGSAPVES